MPKRELSQPAQIQNWLQDWGQKLAQLGHPAALTLIGSGALLWHAAQRQLDTPLPSQSMDVDPITDDELLAEWCYDALIGSEFEQAQGWHVNLMPHSVLETLPLGWQDRAATASYGLLTVIVPAVPDLLAPKLKRGEPRDQQHADWAKQIGLIP